MSTRSDLTEMLEAADRTDGGVDADRLLPVVYEDLREMAARQMRREGAGHMLQPTALVHEVYMKLVDHTRVGWRGRTHFVAVASNAMRQVLVDHARHEKRQKRGGGRSRIPLRDDHALCPAGQLDAADLADAIAAMELLDPGMAAVAEMRLLGGLNADEIADRLELSRRTVFREWKVAKAWLRRHLAGSQTSDEPTTDAETDETSGETMP